MINNAKPSFLSILIMTNQQLDCGDLLQFLWLLKPEGLFIGADVKLMCEINGVRKYLHFDDNSITSIFFNNAGYTHDV